jgi:octopine/nopaline transport system substrate-binding protein
LFTKGGEMNKKIIMALFGATLVTSASALFQHNGPWTTVKIGTEGAYPPWNGTSASGQLEGAEVDLAMDLCARMSVECVLVAQDWDGIIPALQNGKYDAIMAGMSITSERMEVIDFSQGYATEPASFSTLSSSSVASLGVSGNVNLDLGPSADVDALKAALNGSVVGVQGSTTHENFVRDVLGSSVTLKTYDTQQNLELDLAAGRIDAALSDSGSMEGFIASGNGSDIVFIGPKLGGGQFGPGVGVGLRQSDSDLKDMFNKAINEARADGTLATHFTKWFGKDISM